MQFNKDNIQAILKSIANGCEAGIGARPTMVIKRRVTAAEINSGANLLDAVPGYKFQVNDMALVAIGGAAATSTSVNIIGTRNGAAVQLLAAAVAGLTQSTMLRAGAANAAILPDGASFTELDAGTPVTIGKVGGNLSGATAVDVTMSYCCGKA